jgi:hypothetical protein
MTQQLRHQVEVTDGIEEASDRSKCRVGADLLQVRLGQTKHILRILLVWAIEQQRPILPHFLVSQNRLAVSPHLLGDSYCISVLRGRSAFGQLDLDFDIGLSAGCQAAHSGKASPLGDGA